MRRIRGGAALDARAMRRDDDAAPDEDDDDDGVDAHARELHAVVLGFAGRMKTQRERARTRSAVDVHKVGGAPVPVVERARDDGANDDVAEATRRLCAVACGSCGRTMTLVTQTYAPRANARARALYVYACARGCRGNAAWACVRAQKTIGVDDANATRGGEVTSEDVGVGGEEERRAAGGGVVERAPAMEDSWDDPESSSWCDGGGDTDALSAELDAMLLATSSSAMTEKEANAEARVDDDDDEIAEGPSAAQALRAAYDASCDKQFAEYYIIADAEPSCTSALSATETAHAESLLTEYANREGVSVSDILTKGDEDSEWAGESYEKGEAIYVDDAYLKFSERLRRAPEQCMRYNAGGMKFIWPTATRPKPTKCDACGAHRVCELQLTPAMVTDVEEALTMHKGDRTRLANEDELLAWDWHTVCVFTCPDSCVSSDDVAADVAYVHEHVLVAESDTSGESLLKATRA